jgi:hypothetical protein
MEYFSAIPPPFKQLIRKEKKYGIWDWDLNHPNNE